MGKALCWFRPKQLPCRRSVTDAEGNISAHAGMNVLYAIRSSKMVLELRENREAMEMVFEDRMRSNLLDKWDIHEFERMQEVLKGLSADYLERYEMIFKDQLDGVSYETASIIGESAPRNDFQQSRHPLN
jgi:hypothetical protein